MPRECRTSGRRRPARPGHGTGRRPEGRRSARHALVAMAAGASYPTAPAGAAVDSALPKSLQTLATLPAHSTRPWSLTLRVSQAGMTTFGVYPLAAQLSQFGAPVDAARTFLPFWPAASQARIVRPGSL